MRDDTVKVLDTVLFGVSMLALCVIVPLTLYKGYKLYKLSEATNPLEIVCAMSDDYHIEASCLVLMSKNNK